MFEEKSRSPQLCDFVSLSIISHFEQNGEIIKAILASIEKIDKTGPWVYFDGTTKGNPQVGRAGVILFISYFH